MPPENEYADLQKVARRATSVKNLQTESTSCEAAENPPSVQ